MAVLGVCAALGSRDRGVVHQHVQRRQGQGEHVGEVGDLIQTGEVGDDEVQPQRFGVAGESVPATLIGQLAYPFVKSVRQP